MYFTHYYVNYVSFYGNYNGIVTSFYMSIQRTMASGTSSSVIRIFLILLVQGSIFPLKLNKERGMKNYLSPINSGNVNSGRFCEIIHKLCNADLLSFNLLTFHSMLLLTIILDDLNVKIFLFFTLS